jgi:hypothetical protein
MIPIFIAQSGKPLAEAMVGPNCHRRRSCEGGVERQESAHMTVTKSRILFHEYALSPFSEKLRRVFGYKALSSYNVPEPAGRR